MAAFRDELLEYLLRNSGQFVDIKELVHKQCGEDQTFEQNDQTLPRCRLNVNLVLRELNEMGWINLTPTNGLSTGHHLNHETNRREFIFDVPVKARLTTKGEIEYKQLIQPPPPPAGHTVVIGGNSTGDILLHSQKSTTSLDFDHRPAETPQANTTNKKNIWASIGKWMLDNIWKIVVGVAIAFIAYKLGFKK